MSLTCQCQFFPYVFVGTFSFLRLLGCEIVVCGHCLEIYGGNCFSSNIYGENIQSNFVSLQIAPRNGYVIQGEWCLESNLIVPQCQRNHCGLPALSAATRTYKPPLCSIFEDTSPEVFTNLFIPEYMKSEDH